MKCIVKFKDGYICEMEHIYNWGRLHMYRTDTAYLLIPYGDIEVGRVTAEEFITCQKEAKELPIPKAPKPTKWVEVKE